MNQDLEVPDSEPAAQSLAAQQTLYCKAPKWNAYTTNF